MALNKLKTQWVAGGVVLGVLATMGVQFGMATVEKQAIQKRVEQFAKGYKAATDKTAFVQNFDYTGSGILIGVNTSSADENDIDCKAVFLDNDGVYAMFAETYRLMESKGYINAEHTSEEWEEIKMTDDYQQLAMSLEQLTNEYYSGRIHELWKECMRRSMRGLE